MGASHMIDTEPSRPPRTAAGTVPTSAASPGRRKGLVLLAACRPRQWAKNLLVLAAPAAAGLLGRPQVLRELFMAFAAMCMASSATYLVNDVRDVAHDRLHPRKRLRPIASGELSPRAALVAAGFLASAALALAAAAAPALAGVVLAYLALTALYSIKLRHVPLADIAAIAAGFVLRSVAGGAATDVRLSRWFILVTGFGAMFLVACKRYAEVRASAGRPATRRTLRAYTPRRLHAAIVLAALGAFASYVGWALTRSDDAWLFTLSALPLLLWLVRYGSLVGDGRGQAPEDLVLRDVGLLALGALWAVGCAIGIYAGV
ncbi:MAG TPA: decaprenyl-phosphate phosphoribosyltransferase [Solirubrobacteraceae bacterium]|nr:decaprenyl-phosphate phosphoribosyltransferase [Solirubrobacteraceae bacterium]